MLTFFNFLVQCDNLRRFNLPHSLVLQLRPVLRRRVYGLGPVPLIHQDLQGPLEVDVDQLVKLPVLLEVVLVTLLYVRFKPGLKLTGDLQGRWDRFRIKWLTQPTLKNVLRKMQISSNIWSV